MELRWVVRHGVKWLQYKVTQFNPPTNSWISYWQNVPMVENEED